MSHLSMAGRDVLEACLGRRGMLIATLVAQSARRRAVARASLSRTLRRLWKAGLVELSNDSGTTLTAYYTAIEDELAAHERAPEAAFATAMSKEICRGWFRIHGITTAEGYLADARERAGWLRQQAKPMRYVCLTSQGRELAERLIARRRVVNQTEEAKRLTVRQRVVNRNEHVA